MKSLPSATTLTNPTQCTTVDDRFDFTQRSALWSQCQLLLVSHQQYEIATQRFSGALVERIDHAQALRDCLTKLGEQRFAYIGVASPRITNLFASDRCAADALRRRCTQTTLFANQSMDPTATELRKRLHSVGFYEIAEVQNGELNNVAYSSVSGLPDGSFELQSTRPGVPCAEETRVLLASRYALSPTINNQWTLYGNPLRADSSGGFTSSDDAEIGLATCELLTESHGEPTPLLIKASVSWEQNGTAGSFAGLVGSYSGPGDSNMYVAILDSYASPFAQISIWRCDNNWERIAHTHLPLCSEKNSHCVEFALAVTPTAVEVRVDSVPVLWVYDAHIARTRLQGIRMRGNKFRVSNLSATWDIAKSRP